MSYFDRLNKVLDEEGAGGRSDPTSGAMTKAQQSYQVAEDKLGQVKSTEYSKIGTMVGLKLGGGALMKRAVGSLQGRAGVVSEARDTASRAKLSELSDQQNTLLSNGERRMGAFQAKQSSANPLPDTDTITQRGGGLMGQDVQTQVPKTTFEGSEVGQEAGTFSRASGLSAGESSALETSLDTARAVGSSVGRATAYETALDTIPIAGEVIGIGTALGEGIKTAIDAHREAKADTATASQSLDASSTAQKYSGFNRPSFGSMALPSMDTSKNPQMLNE